MKLPVMLAVIAGAVSAPAFASPPHFPPAVVTDFLDTIVHMLIPLLAGYVIVQIMFRCNRVLKPRHLILSYTDRSGADIRVAMPTHELTRLYADVMVSGTFFRLIAAGLWRFTLFAVSLMLLLGLIVVSAIFAYGSFKHGAFRNADGTDWLHIYTVAEHYISGFFWPVFCFKCYREARRWPYWFPINMT
jgi:hypothetical protein